MDELEYIKLDFSEIEDYSFPINSPFRLQINYDDIKYDFVVRFSDVNKNLICFANGAHYRNQKTSSGKLITPPFFDRWSWFTFFNDSFIAFSDPIFYYNNKITLGWGIGDKNQWYTEIISLIIKKLANKQQIINDNILFFGSSGGGFVSIALATLIRGSKCLVNNSQFNAMNFNKYHINNVFEILEKEFDNINREEIFNNLKYRFDLIELFKKENYMPDITYYVNVLSEMDIQKHCIPFLNKVLKLKFKSNLDIYFYYEDRNSPYTPHSPINGFVTLNLIKSFITVNLNNDSSFNPQSSNFKSSNELESDEFNSLNSKSFKYLSSVEELKNKDAEIYYLKNDKFIKILLKPIAYLFIISNSNLNELKINLKLYKLLKSTEFFDIGYYLNKYPDLLKSKWCKYFSPQLHYICKGFDENRKFNIDDYNNNSRKELFEDIKNRCLEC